VTRGEALERIEHLQQLGRPEGIYSKIWFKDGGSAETFRGYDLETAWIPPEKRKRDDEANSLHLSLSYDFCGPDDDWPSYIGVTRLSDREFVRLVRSLPDRQPRKKEYSSYYW
jgi:hypothetical protein